MKAKRIISGSLRASSEPVFYVDQPKGLSKRLAKCGCFSSLGHLVGTEST